MHYIWTLVWTFLLVQMVTYVVSSMIGTTYHFATGTILGIGVSILIFILGMLIPNEPSGHDAH